MKLLEQVRHIARVKHFSYRTEKAYVYWIERFVRYHGIRHPNTMGTAEVEQFLTHLAVERRVSASTQNQALGGEDQRRRRKFPLTAPPRKLRTAKPWIHGKESGPKSWAA
jgi:hypothetical protein